MLKRNLIFILVAVFALIPLSAYCTETSDIVHWVSDCTGGESEDIPVACTLSTGENIIRIDPLNSTCAYKVDIGETGLYAISLSFEGDYGYSIYCSESVDGSDVTGCRLGGYADDYGDLYYFEENDVQYYCIWVETESDQFCINFEYLGKVTDISIAGEKNTFQAGMEAFINESEEGINYFSVYSGFDITTDKSLSFTDTVLSLPVEISKLSSGENTIQAKAYGFEKELKFNIYYASDYIESITPDTGFLPPVAKYSDEGYLEELDVIPECGKLVLNLKDGSDVHVDIDASQSYIFFETNDGNIINLYSTYDFGDNEFYEDGCPIKYGLTDDVEFFFVADISPENKNPEENIFTRIFNFIKSVFGKVINFFRYLISLINL